MDTISDKLELSTEFVDYKLENGILFMTYKAKKISLQDAKKIVKTRLQFTKNKSYPLFIDERGMQSADKDARDYFSSKEGTYLVSAGALYAKSMFFATMANFFLKVTRPPIPARLFTDKAKAIQWLQQFK